MWDAMAPFDDDGESLLQILMLQQVSDQRLLAGVQSNVNDLIDEL
jgi:hypothetical protein